jgi:hypothetical protein
VNVTPTFLSPHRLLLICVFFAAVGIGVLIPVTRDLPLKSQAILAIGLAGLATLLVVPNRRIVLVCAWVLAHPLSLEKVFPVFPPPFPGFMPPAIVISGSDLIFAVLIAVMIWEGCTSDKKLFYWPAAATPYLILVGWVCAAFFWRGAVTGTSIIQVAHWIKMLVFLLFLSSAIQTREELLTVLVAVAVAVLVQSLILGTSYALNRKLGFSDKVTSTGMMGFTSGGAGASVITRATGTVGHVNQQAMFHTFFSVPIAALLMVRNWLWRLFIGVVLVGSMCAVILTFSRASWISCLLAAAVIVFLAWRHRRIGRMGWLGISLGSMAAVLLVAIFSPMIVTRLTKGDDGATSSRMRMAWLALDNGARQPLTGVGPGGFINARLAENPIRWQTNVWVPRGEPFMPRDVSGIDMLEVFIQGKWFYVPGVVHNKFLLTFAELGLIGLSLFIWFHFRLFKHALRGLRTRDPLLWWVAAALVGFFWAAQSEYMFELFYDDKTILTPLFLMTLIINLDRIVSQEQEPLPNSA